MRSKQSDKLTQQYLDNVNTAAQEFEPPPGFIAELAKFTGLARQTVNRWFSTTSASRPLVPPSIFKDKTRTDWDTNVKDSDRIRLLLGQLLEGGIERKGRNTGDLKTRELYPSKEEPKTLMRTLRDAWEIVTRDKTVGFYSAAFTSIELKKDENGTYFLDLGYRNAKDVDGSDDYYGTDIGPGEDEEIYYSPLELIDQP